MTYHIGTGFGLHKSLLKMLKEDRSKWITKSFKAGQATSKSDYYTYGEAQIIGDQAKQDLLSQLIKRLENDYAPLLTKDEVINLLKSKLDK